MKKLLKIFLFLFFILGTGLGVAGWLFLRHYNPERLVTMLETRVHQKTNGRYQLALDSLSYSLRDLSVGLYNFRFERDTTTDDLSGISLFDRYDISVFYNDLEVKYFDLLRFVRKSDLEVDSFRLTHPRIIMRQNMAYRPELGADSLSSPAPSVDTMAVDSAALQKLVDTTIHHSPILEIGWLQLDNAQFEFYEGGRQRPMLQVKGLHLRSQNIRSTEDAPLDSKNFELRLDTALVWVGKYTARLEAYHFLANDSIIRFDSLRYYHVISATQLNRMKGFRATQLDITANGIAFLGADMNRMIADSGLIIRKVALEHLSVRVGKDQTETRINPSYKPLPPTIVQEIPVPVQVDTVDIKAGIIVLDQHPAGAKKNGVLRITQVQGLITNVTNIPETIAQNPVMTIGARGRLMGSGPVALTYRFRLDDPDDRFQATGELGKMPLTDLNPFIEPMALLRFAQGQIEGVSFRLSGTEHHAEGEMDFEYTDLKLAKLENYQEIVDENPGSGFLIGLANFLIPSNRLKTRAGYKPGIMYAEKDYNRPLLHYTIESIASGVMSSMGFGPKDPVKAAENKKDRAARKAERDQERERKKAERLKRQEEKKKRRNRNE